MYREAASRERDSGWRLFSGDEDEAYLSDPKNTAIMNVYEGTAFERSSPAAAWLEVKNWR